MVKDKKFTMLNAKYRTKQTVTERDSAKNEVKMKPLKGFPCRWVS